MGKYNITEKKEKEAHYRTLVNPKLMDEMKERILDIIVMQKKYKDKDYSAKKLAEELGTNTRYISAVVNVRFHMNYTSFVNKFRIEEAMTILVDRRYQDLRIEEVSDMVGFANRQSFYASFYKLMNMTPRDYRFAGLEEQAPFDSIIVTCGAPEVPIPLLKQLKPGGRLVIPVDLEGQEGSREKKQILKLIVKTEDGRFKARNISRMSFVPMLKGVKRKTKQQ